MELISMDLVGSNIKKRTEKNISFFKKLAFLTLLFLVLLTTFTSAYGFLGQHRTCPRCGGTGRDPYTLFLTPCPMCDGDGKIGIFINDEKLEDFISYLLIIIIIVEAINASRKGSRRD
jgi:hypothetical protein